MSVVIVSGASRGLGAAVMDATRAAGWTAIGFDVVAPDTDHLHELVDVADTRAVEAGVERVRARHHAVDALVTCAGVDHPGPFGAVDAATWERVLTINLLGTVRLVRAVLPDLVSQHGRVVTVASTLGLRALPDATAYCASKFGVVGFTRALTLELRGQVGVTLVIPGGMHTTFFDAREDQYKPPPDAKLNDPANVAAAIVVALSQPPGCEVRELVITPSEESSWP